MSSENRSDITFQINDEIVFTLKNVDKEDIIQRSKLLKDLFESLGHFSAPHEPIKLKLEHPENFSILSHYLETGEISEELSGYKTFTSYINDIVYLGCHELKSHMFYMLCLCIAEKQTSQLDFSKSRPNYDFIEAFLETFSNKISMRIEVLDLNELCKLLIKCVGNHNIDPNQTTCCDMMTIFAGIDRLRKYINFEKLSAENVNQLRGEYGSAFDVVMLPSFVVKYNCRDPCRKCGQMVSCSKEQYYAWYSDLIQREQTS